MKAAAKIVKEENRRVAELLGINSAARTTCVKPAGTTSLTLGTDYSHKNKKNNFDTINLSLGLVFNLEKNDDMPKQSSLNQKTSELIGDFGLNIYEFNRINY